MPHEKLKTSLRRRFLGRRRELQVGDVWGTRCGESRSAVCKAGSAHRTYWSKDHRAEPRRAGRATVPAALAKCRPPRDRGDWKPIPVGFPASVSHAGHHSPNKLAYQWPSLM